MNNLSSFFSPSSIAIVGVSEDPKKVGYLVAQNCIKQGYTGELYLINPKHKELFGKKLYPSLSAIGKPIDLAVLATPADVSLKLLDELHALQVQNVVLFAAGFKEGDEEGKKREQALVQKAHDYNMSILGPNCIGFVNTVCGANLTFLKHSAPKGNIGFISQSGALGSLMVDYLVNHKNYGFSYFISLGNKTVLDESDMLLFLADDPDTKVIGMYLEDVKRGEVFKKVLREVVQKKPVVVLKSGTTSEGSKAAVSHTGSMIGDDAVYSSVFEQNGAMRAHQFFEFMTILKLFAYGRAPKSREVMILSNAGGLGVLLTDELIAEGLSLVTISEEARKEIITTMGAQRVTVHNPIDLLGDAKAFHYKQAIQITMKERDIGSVVILLTPQANTEIEETSTIIASAQEWFDAPIYPIFMGEQSVGHSHEYFEEKSIASFTTYDHLPVSIRKIREYEEWKQRITSQEEKSKDETIQKNQDIENSIHTNEGKSFLNTNDSIQILEKMGIPVVPYKTAQTEDEIKEYAANIGYPVVLKISSNIVTHKTEKGGVITNVKDEEELIQAYTRLCDITQEKTVMVQKMTKGYELIIGAKRDSTFGTVVLLGLGGIYAELVHETVQFVEPLTYTQFESVCMRSKLKRFMKGFRGMKPLDVKQVYKIVCRVFDLLRPYPQIKEIDINPLMVEEGKPVAVDGRIVLL